VNSEPGQGTAFVIHLPCQSGAEAEADEDAAEEA